MGPREGMRRILVVEDDEEMRRLLAEFLRLEGIGVDEVAEGSEALERVHQKQYDSVVLDKDLASGSGLDVLPCLRALAPKTPVIFMTAFGDGRTVREAFARGAHAVLLKPFRLDHLLEVICRAREATRAALPGGREPDPEGGADEIDDISGATP